jgi:hypothetical protein
MRKSGQHPITAIDIDTLEVIKAEAVILTRDSSIETLKTTIMAHVGFWFDMDQVAALKMEEDPAELESRVVAHIIFKDGQQIAVGINESEEN